MRSFRRFEMAAPDAALATIPAGFIILPLIVPPAALLAMQQMCLYQAAYAQAKALLAPPRHSRLLSCLN